MARNKKCRNVAQRGEERKDAVKEFCDKRGYESEDLFALAHEHYGSRDNPDVAESAHKKYNDTGVIPNVVHAYMEHMRSQDAYALPA